MGIIAEVVKWLENTVSAKLHYQLITLYLLISKMLLSGATYTCWKTPPSFSTAGELDVKRPALTLVNKTKCEKRGASYTL